MDALRLFLIAFWLWFVLVVAERNHMRSALLLPVIVVLRLTAYLLVLTFQKIDDALHEFSIFIANAGHEKDGAA